MRRKIFGVLLIVAGLVLHADSFSGGGGSSSGAITQISKRTLGSNTATVTFSSIPGTYTDLVLTVEAQSTAAATTDNIVVQFNGDTGTNYDAQSVSGTGSTASAGMSAPTATPALCTMAAANSGNTGAAGVCVSTIPNYSATTFWKVASTTIGVLSNTVGPSVISGTFFLNWRSTAAITAIQLTLASAGNFVTGSTFTLWGRT